MPTTDSARPPGFLDLTALYSVLYLLTFSQQKFVLYALTFYILEG